MSLIDARWNYKEELEGQTPMRTKGGITMLIERASKEDLPAILELQYLAYQSEAKLLNNPEIPPLKQTLQEVEQELAIGTILKVLDEDDAIVGSVRCRSYWMWALVC
ncbi:MAG: hypothetical protein ACRDBO_17150 [Lachnospiraceae bacterium]